MIALCDMVITSVDMATFGSRIAQAGINRPSENR